MFARTDAAGNCVAHVQPRSKEFILLDLAFETQRVLLAFRIHAEGCNGIAPQTPAQISEFAQLTQPASRQWFGAGIGSALDCAELS
ncbi:hypothetical protein [Variovorax sp. H27-G14]|uniref:hypothetical protein n=1 Tax=Variovorax sp. H27-G14 TaxID=3111914 RepID=UPI0038FCD64E